MNSIKKIFKTEQFLFNYDNDLEPVVLQFQKMENYDKILKIFGINKFRQVKVNLFNNQEDFIDFIKILRGENAFIPKYCKGTFDNNEINLSLDKNDNDMSNACGIFHELVHIIYQELFYYRTSDNRIIWFDEGLAQSLSGEKGLLKTKEQMKLFIERKIISKNIPAISELCHHGESFFNENYNGYDISFLCVKYLIDTKTKEEFLNLIKDTNKVRNIEKNIINDAIKFYNEKNNTMMK